ncbi:MAG: FG-GAP repeat protein, partial [Deltaproteobacteria bacterium]|nr:FG-GAP repeat protein [Deltaproteobacteria bacterium]
MKDKISWRLRIFNLSIFLFMLSMISTSQASSNHYPPDQKDLTSKTILADLPPEIRQKISAQLDRNEYDTASIEKTQPDGRQILSFGGLKARDAQGRILSAKLSLRGRGPDKGDYGLSYVVDDSQAVYPLTIAPIFSQGSQIIAFDGATNDVFGLSVSVSADAIVVGAPGKTVGGNVGQGMAYVFYRNQGGTDNWGQVQKLLAPDDAANDHFGDAVSISGDIIVIGAQSKQVGGNVGQGAAYVFYRNQGGTDNWGQVKILAASDGTAKDLFGWSVAVSSDTIAVGASTKQIGGNVGQGAAYVYYRNQGGTNNWGPVQ